MCFRAPFGHTLAPTWFPIGSYFKRQLQPPQYQPESFSGWYCGGVPKAPIGPQIGSQGLHLDIFWLHLGAIGARWEPGRGETQDQNVQNCRQRHPPHPKGWNNRRGENQGGNHPHFGNQPQSLQTQCPKRYRKEGNEGCRNHREGWTELHVVQTSPLGCLGKIPRTTGNEVFRIP